jgi:hypothetical protein
LLCGCGCVPLTFPPAQPPTHPHMSLSPTPTQTRVGRPYGRVCRRKLRAALVAAVANAGSVAFLPASVEGVTLAQDGTTATVACSGGVRVTSRWAGWVSRCGHTLLRGAAASRGCEPAHTHTHTYHSLPSLKSSTSPLRLVTLASGQAAGRLLAYESDAPSVAAQTAYGIEADVQVRRCGLRGRLRVVTSITSAAVRVWQRGSALPWPAL